jgi:hypothetical protein
VVSYEGDGRWTSSTSSPGGGAVIVQGTGAGSSVRVANNNISSATGSTVSGGYNNQATDAYAVIAGGSGNTANGSCSTIGGGRSNSATDTLSTVAGGFSNSASGTYATVGGGINNSASASRTTIGGGCSNSASANYTTIGGGVSNIASALFATVGGGCCNQATAACSSILGGASNTARSIFGVIGGGTGNTIGTSSDYGFIGSGRNNVIFNGSVRSAILGGTGNSVTGGVDDAFIIGSNITACTSNYTYVEGLSIGVTAPSASDLEIAAGTNTVVPIKLTSGTNLSTPATGGIEFDGFTTYFTPSASARSVTRNEQMIVLSNANTLGNQTTIQPLFDGGGGPANGALTLNAGAYRFETVFVVSGMTSASKNVTFTLGGTAIKTEGWMVIVSGSNNPSTLATPGHGWQTTATALLSGSTSTNMRAQIQGVLRVSATGTLIPQVTTSAAGTTPTVVTNSWFLVYPIGASGTTGTGRWS